MMRVWVQLIFKEIRILIWEAFQTVLVSINHETATFIGSERFRIYTLHVVWLKPCKYINTQIEFVEYE